jgi:hypothetical protein
MRAGGGANKPVLETEIEERVGGLGDEYGVLDVYSRTRNI